MIGAFNQVLNDRTKDNVNRNNYKLWCQQLFPTSNIMKGSVTYTKNTLQNLKPKMYELCWCSKFDESVPHWCDNRLAGYWKDKTHGQHYGWPIINNLTCQI